VRLVVTRPEPDGERTAQGLRARGHQVLVAPLLQIETERDIALGEGPWAAVVMTSANAARALEGHGRLNAVRTLPLFAVGRRTADAARAAGFADVRSADGDAAVLLRLLRGLGGAHPALLYVAGADRARDLAAELAPHDIRVETVVGYRARAVTELPPRLRAALAAGEVDGALHFSRRSAEIYLDRSSAAGLRREALSPRHFCLSAEVAEPLKAAGATRIHAAPRPDEASLLATIG
jgi:uroporphyrinogen-III synthase